MENKKIPTHDPYNGDLNPYYELLTGKQNPLVFIEGNVNLDKKTLNYAFFKIKSEEFCNSIRESISYDTAFMEGVKSAMKEILTKNEYENFINS